MSCKKCDDKYCSLPSSICPVPPFDDDDKALGGGCLLVLLVVFIAAAYFQTRPHPRSPAPLKQPVVVVPAEKPYAEFPLLSRHCETCKQCASPISETGEEQGLCEEGFRLFQEDLRNNAQ